MRFFGKLVIASLICVVLTSSIALAAEDVSPITLPTSISFNWVKTKEWLMLNLFTYKKASKASLYNGYSDRRVSEMQYAFEMDDSVAIEKSLNRYENQKQKSLEYANKANDTGVMQKIRERTLKQQREMTRLQLNLSNNGELQQNIVRVQKQVANQTHESVKIVEGQDEADVVETQTWVIWRDPNADVNGSLPAILDNLKLEYAPGTTAGGGGKVYEGGSQHIWAPGTSSGGSSSVEKSENVIKINGSGESNSGNTVQNDVQSQN